MFNHARTLFVNLDGGNGVFVDTPGDELIPADFKKLTLPSYLENIRSQLLGVSPDRFMLNFRAAQVFRLIEKTELQEYVLALDSRITYSSQDNSLSDPTTYEPKITRVGLPDSAQLTLTGSPNSPDISGIAHYRYTITPDVTQVIVQRQVFPSVTDTIPLTLTAGLSQTFDLPFSGYQAVVNTLSSGGNWQVEGYNKPRMDLTQVVSERLSNLGEPTYLQLFGISDVEPYLTFKNCWKSHPDFAYKLGGLVLAMIYRTDEVRNG